MYFRQIYIFILAVSIFTTGCEKLTTDPGDSTVEEVQSDEGLNYWGGSYNDEGHAVAQTDDGGYAIAGSQYSTDTQFDLSLVTFNSSLVEQKKKVLDFVDSSGDSFSNYANDILQNDDGGYIIVGSTFNGTDMDVLVIKFNTNLDTLWTATIGGVVGYNDYGNSIEIMAGNSGYLVCGTSYDGTNSDFDARLWTISMDGQTVTSKYTGDTGNASNDYGNYAQQTYDGGYIMITTNMTIATSTQTTNVIKLVAAGTADANFVDVTGTLSIAACDEGIYVQQLYDGSYIIVGNTETGTGQQSNVYINTVTSAGDPGTAITMGESYNDKVTCVRQTLDGGFVFTGSKYKQSSMKDVWIVKLNAALSIEWDYTYGGDKNDHGQSIAQTDDGGYVITGSTMSYGNQSEIMLLKLNNLGVVEDIVGSLNASSGN